MLRRSRLSSKHSSAESHPFSRGAPNCRGVITDGTSVEVVEASNSTASIGEDRDEVHAEKKLPPGEGPRTPEIPAEREELKFNVHVLQNSNQNLKGIIVNLGVGPVQILYKIAGGLAFHVRNLVEITKDKWVLDPIKGYQIDFVGKPYQTKWPHTSHYSVEQNCWIEQVVRDLLQKGAMSRLQAGQSS